MAATLKDVAEQAGVSIRTAGRALRGDGPVKDEVARRVLAAAEALQYVPNAAARNLKQRENRIVGVVISGGSHRFEAGQRRLRYLEEALRERELHTLLAALPKTPEELEKLLRGWSGLVREVVFLAWPEEWQEELLARYPLHPIFIDCGHKNPLFDNLLTDRASGVKAVVGEWLRQGVQRITHLTGVAGGGRRDGILAAIRESGRDVQLETVDSVRLAPHDDYRAGYLAGQAIFAHHPEAIFCDTDRLALGFYRYAHEHQVAIPGDVMVAGFDNDTSGTCVIPTLTSVEQPDREQVAQAIELIANRGEHSPATHISPSKPVLRESTRRT